MDRHVYRVLCCLGLCLGMGLAGSEALAGARSHQETTLLVVPARPSVVQLALDLAGLRRAVVLSYRTEARGADPLLHVWKNGAWQYVSPDDFRECRFMSECPRRVVMIGDDQTMPVLLTEEAAWGADVTRLKTLHIADLINGLDPVLHFTASEWKWLARRYDLDLKDVNEPRREFNPYDIPRSKLPLATREFKQTKGDEPPAVLIESPAEEVEQPDAEIGQPAAVPDARDPTLK